MIFTSHKEPNVSTELYIFLRQEFGLTESAIDLGVKHSQMESAPLHIILWNFGLIDINQYQILLDWIDQNNL